MRPALAREKDLRERLGRIKVKRDGDGKEGGWAKGGLREYVEVCEEMKRRMDVSIGRAS